MRHPETVMFDANLLDGRPVQVCVEEHTVKVIQSGQVVELPPELIPGLVRAIKRAHRWHLWRWRPHRKAECTCSHSAQMHSAWRHGACKDLQNPTVYADAGPCPCPRFLPTDGVPF